MSQTICIRRGSESELAAYGILEQAELGLCTDTKQVYIGDGSINIPVGYSYVLSGALCLWGIAEHYTWGMLENTTWQNFQFSGPLL